MKVAPKKPLNTNSMIYTALGFPILLHGVRSKNVRGVDVPDVNLNTLQKVVFEALIAKPSNLTGAEVGFIRSYLRMNQTDFAKALHLSSHSIVSQWEKKALKPTGMDYNTEIWLRLMMTHTGKRSDLISYVEGLFEQSPFKTKAKPEPIEINYQYAA